MANSWWNSSSINSYFRNSFGSKSTPFDGVYGSLGDAKMIKKGSYKKLMKSYVSSLKENETSSTDKTEATDKKKDVKRKNVLDSLLNKKTTSSKVSNKILDELLKKDTSYNNDGTKKQTATNTSTVDEKV